MKVLVYMAFKTMEYCDVLLFMLVVGESLIRIQVVGICGSDMHAWHGHDMCRTPPLILGHEVAGVVVVGKFQGCMVL